MAGENTDKIVDAAEDNGDARQRSTIGFPYNNLGDAIEVAQAIHSNVGTGDCDDAQLSAWMNLSPKSSGYRIQVSAARMFGLVETAAGRHRLSQLGRMIVDPAREREARARAFLTVPLYRAIFDHYNGGILPPAAALERDIVGLGVAEKQTSRARQVFERSAEQAAFFEHGRNRLVMPGFVASVTEAQNEGEISREDKPGGGGGDGGGEMLDLDPLLVALLKKIPPADKGWPAAQRIRWFRTFAMNVSQIYDEDDEPVEMEIKGAEGA